MIEIELKYRSSEWERIRLKLNELGAISRGIGKDSDHYFNAPDRDFRETDEAVRIRRSGDRCVMTYKGPRIDQTRSKTRTEIELPLIDGSQNAANAVRFLTNLGFRPVAVVAKVRETYSLEHSGQKITICLDDVGSVGRYVEVEVVVLDETRLAQAEAVVLEIAGKLDLKDVERRSYLEMLLER